MGSAREAHPGGFRLRELGRPGDLGWVVMAHGQIYAQEYGWDSSCEALVARIVADYANTEGMRQRAWIADVDGERVGCVFCVEADTKTAQLRLLLVEPPARGLGIGSSLVQTCIDFATGHGFERMKLWTNDPLTSAAGIYVGMGFVLTAEEAHHSFGVDLVGQTYERVLQSDSVQSASPKRA
jgi:GNAT superfamily N-acetyltransferase